MPQVHTAVDVGASIAHYKLHVRMVWMPARDSSSAGPAPNIRRRVRRQAVREEHLEDGR